MRKFWKSTEADMNMILAAVVMAIALAIGVIIVFNVIASVNVTTIDAGLTGTPATNATTDLLENVEAGSGTSRVFHLPAAWRTFSD